MLLTLGQQLKINDLINLFEPTKQGTLDFKRENATLHLSNHETWSCDQYLVGKKNIWAATNRRIVNIWLVPSGLTNLAVAAYNFIRRNSILNMWSNRHPEARRDV
jgi:hypothetical protein